MVPGTYSLEVKDFVVLLIINLVRFLPFVAFNFTYILWSLPSPSLSLSPSLLTFPFPLASFVSLFLPTPFFLLLLPPFLVALILPFPNLLSAVCVCVGESLSRLLPAGPERPPLAEPFPNASSVWQEGERRLHKTSTSTKSTNSC